jgi:hypothetical protein
MNVDVKTLKKIGKLNSIAHFKDHTVAIWDD